MPLHFIVHGRIVAHWPATRTPPPLEHRQCLDLSFPENDSQYLFKVHKVIIPHSIKYGSCPCVHTITKHNP